MNRIFRAPIARPFKILLCLAITSLSAEGAAAKSPISLDVLQRDGYGSVKLTKGWRNNTLFVPAEINGRKIDLLLDTGWELTMASRSDEIRPSCISCRKRACEMGISANGNRTPMRHGIAQSVVMGNVHVRIQRIYFGRFAEFWFLGHGFLKRMQCDHRSDKSAGSICVLRE